MSTSTQWTTFRDSREQAFSIQVPAGWNVQGGMFRLGALCPRPAVDMTSPDGKINIRIGDPQMPVYMLSHPVLGRRFETAQEYVAQHGPARFRQVCHSVEPRCIRAVEPRIHRQPVPGGQSTAAEAFFICSRNGQQMLGYVYQETWSTAPAAGGFWDASIVGTFLAPMEQAQFAGEILTDSWKTFAFSPAWLQAMSQATMASAARSTPHIRRPAVGVHVPTHVAPPTINDYGMQARQQQADSFSDILTGTTLARDPSNGRVWEVQSGTGGKQWINNQNQVIESAMSPGIGFRRLQNMNR